ncbi:hypothetical protein HYDPIDRAFT_120124 [Hydnomerulius pinastri MD-312]|uniref:Uncharacterized protein n=1 Tax=Hydnomerulius pinastri MD-312 TaxID=994086 RepID=A0A0C9VKE6_9AGAM|nr:hypothetical protein HYDPIDRAFT_120124 [Hydnomerulius pinastri MD-312]
MDLAFAGRSFSPVETRQRAILRFDHLLMFRFDTISRSVSTAPLDPDIYLTLSHLTSAMCLRNSQLPLVTGAMRILSRCTLHFTNAMFAYSFAVT